MLLPFLRWFFVLDIRPSWASGHSHMQMTKRCNLSGAIAPEDRRNLRYWSQELPLGLYPGDWPSALITTYIFQILVEEKLGVITNLTGYADGSLWIWYALLGCDEPSRGELKGAKCPDANAALDEIESLHHMSLETWSSSKTHHDKMIDVYKSRAPAIIGDVGYKGVEGMFVTDTQIRAALNSEGLHLEYYGNWNSSWFHPGNYFAQSYDQVNQTQLLRCDAEDAVFSNTEEINTVIEFAPDVEGFNKVHGGYKAKCADGYWWLSPACRRLPRSKCVPWITAGSGWWLTSMLQKSILYNMPLAIANVASTGAYAKIPTEVSVSMYWWTPDVTFLSIRPKPVVFPAHDKVQWSKGNMATGGEEKLLYKVVYHKLKLINEKIVTLAQRLTLTTNQMESILIDQLHSGKSEFSAACTWLKENADIWESWIPFETECLPGQGLLNEQGEHVMNRSQAVSCGWCTAGRYAKVVKDDIGSTSVCILCPVGYSNAFPAMSACVACEPGRFAKDAGQRECNTCWIGYYAERPGQTQCIFCAEGKQNHQTWTTMKKRDMAHGKFQVVVSDGATSSSECGCDHGHQETLDGECVRCTTGMVCKDMNVVEILPGYAWDGELSVYRCHSDQRRCPGGKPGVCAAGRDNTSVACSECIAGKAEASNGSCTDCDDSDKLPLAMFCAFVPFAIMGLYFGMELFASNKIATTSPQLLMLCCATLMLTVIQQLMITGLLSVTWNEPMKSLLEISKVWLFDVDILRLNCITRFNAFGRYATRMIFIGSSIFLLYLVHVFAVVIFWKGSLAKNRYRFIRSIGALLAFFYIIVLSSILMPFICADNPNGNQTLLADSSVLCWSAGNHADMISLGLASISLPLLIISVLAWVVHVFPKKVSLGDTRFLLSWNFLFIRFKTDTYWYPLWMLVRNTLVTLAPILPGTFDPIVALAIVMSLSWSLTHQYKPWRLHSANILDILCHNLIMFVLLMCSFLVSCDVRIVSRYTFVVVVAVLVCIAFVFGYACYSRFSKAAKTYQYFICHHKSGTGALSRLLKLYLLKEKNVTGKVFIDSDDLQDLDLLFRCVRDDTRNLVVVVSAQIFQRCWCAGEMVTACENSVNIVPVMVPGGKMPSDELIAEYEELVPDICKIYKYGIDIDMVQNTLNMIRCLEKEANILKSVSARSMETLASEIISSSAMEKEISASTLFKHVPCSEDITNAFTNLTPKVLCESQEVKETYFKTTILVDHANMEAVSTAIFLKSLVTARLSHTPEKIPHILEPNDELSDTVNDVILILTNGVFHQPSIVVALLAASQMEATILPILTDENFRFPTTEVLCRDMRNSDSLSVARRTARHGQTDALAELVEECFHVIGICFRPDRYSEAVLETKAVEVAKRLLAPKRASTKRLSLHGTGSHGPPMID